MNDYIKREDAVNAVYHHFPSLTMAEVQTMLHEAQSADVQPVVRCKDLKLYCTGCGCNPYDEIGGYIKKPYYSRRGYYCHHRNRWSNN